MGLPIGRATQTPGAGATAPAEEKPAVTAPKAEAPKTAWAARPSGARSAVTGAEPALVEGTADEMMKSAVDHEKKGTLRSAVSALVAKAENIVPQKERKIVKTVHDALQARMAIEGHLKLGKGPHYLEWHKENARIVQRSTQGPAGEGVTGPAFVKRFEELGGGKFVGGSSTTLLVNGPASFKERYRLIDEAKQSIHLGTWKLYGDDTGKKTVDALLAKHAKDPHVDIKVMVDGNVAAGDPESGAQLKRLVDAGIPVAYYHHNDRAADGHHYKAMVVDGASAHGATVAGGMNIGDEYSHAFGTAKADDPNRQQWRDTDVLVQGPAVYSDEQQFAQLWNTQVDLPSKVDPFHQKLPRLELPAAAPAVAKTGDSKVLVAVDEPGPTSQQKVTSTMVAAIHAAKRSVDIENAYVMDVPAIRDTLVEAMKRGVRVRVLTNSTGTIDDTVVSAPIQKGLQNLLSQAEAAGKGDLCEVYVRNKLHPNVRYGDTVHSKLMVVDGELSQVASYNIHGRSMRLEVEGAHWMMDPDFAKTVGDQFARDIAPDQATRFKTAADVKIPTDMLSRVMLKLNLDPVIL